MKITIYLLLLLAVVLLPVQASDVGELIPVEVLAISENQDLVQVNTDMADAGTGKTMQEALSDMEDTAAGVIYLDTVEYVILEQGMEELIPGLRSYLKDSVRVCYGREGIPLEEIARYLSVHKPGRRLAETGEIPVITEEEGRYRIIRK